MIKEVYKVKSIKKELCKEWLLYKHYLKRKTSYTYSFGLFKEKKLVGIITFGNAIPLTMKKSLFGKKYMNLVYELNRLCTNDNLDKNANSFFISQSFKLLPKPMIIVSYADKYFGHNGYVYQATNFMFTGESHTQLDWKLKGKEHLHSRTLMDEFAFEKNRIEKLKEKYGDKLYQVKREAKYRYVYVIANKKQKKEIIKHKRFNILKYPKGQNTNYDTSYKTTTQTELF
tara:strand:+ start:44 stop:730 length:687 start_codon:yes stop_codon:yes gene_type:complete